MRAEVAVAGPSPADRRPRQQMGGADASRQRVHSILLGWDSYL
jgi:hypothetical protein